MSRCLPQSRSLKSLLASPCKEVRSGERPGQSSKGAQGPVGGSELHHCEGSPSSFQVTECLVLRSRCAPRRLLTCRAADRPASSRGSGTGHGPVSDGVPRLAAAMELPRELPAPGRVPVAVAAAVSAPWTAPIRPPPPRAPGTVPGAPHPGPAAALRSAPARGGSAPTSGSGEEGPRLPASHRHRLPLSSVLPSTLQNQPTRHSGPSSREGRGGAGREVGEPGGGGGGARGAQLEPAFLLPGAKPTTPTLLPCLLPRPRSNAGGLWAS